MYSLIGLDQVVKVIKERKLDSLDKDFYDFGVCSGSGTIQVLDAFNRENIVHNKCWGFDSWQGLPEEAPGLFRPDIWHKGAFKASKELHIPEEQVVHRVLSAIKEYTDNVELISGFFSDSLTDKLTKIKIFKPALFISIDVDLYISSYQALDFMAKNDLIMKGTIIRYDEWGDFTHPLWKGNKEYEFGESRSHKEICEKYNLIFEDIFLGGGVKVVIRIQ